MADNRRLAQRLRLRIDAFGRFVVRYGDREIVLNGRKARALLGYLALSESGQETRERLVGLLWSETEEGKARASLRQTLYEIREAFQAVGFDKFDADKHVIRIDRDALEVDLWEVMGSAKRGEPHAILLERDRATESLLSELESVDPSFRNWLLAKRQSLHDRLVAHLEDVLRGQVDAASSRNEEQVARALTKLDPTHEEAARALIRARVAARDVVGALNIYRTLWNLLEEEYDVEPSKETQELIAAVKLGQPIGMAAPGTGRPPELKRPGSELAVVGDGLPAKRAGAFTQGKAQKLVLSIGGFDGAGVGEDHRYLVQGFRRELAASLVRFREWSVRDQGHAPAGASPSVSGAGEYIVDASAFDTGSGVRLILMLRDAVTNNYVWSERLQLSLDGWFDAQQSVVRRLATALNVHLSAERIAAITFQPVQDLRAYDLWLRGHALLLNFAPKEWHEAEDLFRKIITEMPTFGPAYSSLANAQNVIHLAHPGTFRNLERAEQALTLAREAVRLDPIDTRAQLCLGWACLMAEQYDMGEIHHGLAQELNENDPWTMISTALGAAFCGDHHGARARADRALSLTLDPSPIHWGYQSQIRFLSGDYRGTLEACQRAGPHSHFPAWKAAALFQLNRKDEAAAEFRDFSKAMAERWFGQSPSTPELIGKWFLHSFPIKNPSAWEHLRDSIAGAGIPVAGLKASFWQH
jgi:DNA-binding SARP family transcriptional activator/TolB-like protein